MDADMIQSRREGFALATTILAMLVVGAIVTGGFYAASQEGQVARSSGNADDAAFIAETGMNTTMASANAATLNAMTLNSSSTGSATNVNAGAQVLGNYVARISRVSTQLFFISSTGTVTRGGRYAGASHTVASVVRLKTADFDNQAAVMVFGNMSVGGNAEIDGTDYYPSNWTGVGCSLASGTAAVLTNPGTAVTSSGSAIITGPVVRQPLSATDFTVFGDLTWNELISLKDKIATGTVGPNPVVTGGVCQTANVNNWGSAQPTNACYNYFPIIYAPGDLLIASSGEGQGILLVEGDLDVSGGFNFYGVVVVKGTIRIPGTGGHINGTTLAFGDGQISSTSSTVGNSLLQYSSCSIERAVLNNASLTRLAPIVNRSWMDISAISGGN